MKPKGSRKTFLHFGCLILVGITVYFPSLLSPFHFDDNPSVRENIYIRDSGHGGELWKFWPTRFFLYLTFVFDYHFWRLNPCGYHLTNLAIHILAGFLIYVLARTLLSFPEIQASSWRFESIPGTALIVALVFLCHPLQTEAVTYIIQRATSLAVLLYLLSLVFYLRSLDLGAGQKKFFYSGGLFLFGLALFTKEMVVSLPLIIILYSFMRSPPRKKFFTRVIPFLILALLVPILVMLHPDNPHYHDSGQIDFFQESGQKDLLSPQRREYIFTQIRVLITYLRLLLLPVRQNLDYDYSKFFSFWQTPVVLSFLGLSSLIIWALGQKKREAMLLGATFWFFIVLLPESSLIPIKDLISEHRLYLAVFAGGCFFARYLQTPIKSLSPYLLPTLGIFCLGLLTYNRNLIWKDDLTLWQDAVSKSPGKARPYHNLGLARAARGEWVQAITAYRRSLLLEPRFYKSYDNLGVALKETGRWDEARANFLEAIRIKSDYLPAYNNLAFSYLQQGKALSAGKVLNQALAIGPGDLQTRFNYALFLKESGDLQGAEKQYLSILNHFPRLGEAHSNLATLYMFQGDLERAETEFEEVLSLHPDSALSYYNLGNIQASRKDYHLARKNYLRAISLQPDYPEAFNNLGNVYKILGEYRESLGAYLRALSLQPDSEDAFHNLRLILRERLEDKDLHAVFREMVLSHSFPPPLRQKLESVLLEARQ